jgi:ABC-type polysaccharide/polyol phosphate transport system ATPase subunit
MASALTFDGVTKQFRGARTYRSLRDDLASAVGRVAGGRRDGNAVIRALEDVSFEIPEGEAFAIIGPNGAGKTTALKLASRIMYPTSGRLLVRGRVGALIEVGTGLHPELTGRENVNLYGRILGLSRRDVRRRFEQIVDFAGIGPALEQPVKQFSSGMQLRLGFALAAHLEPDVLLVDEAIAVGDASFQYRCVERMSELVREGRTLVFVSHDMAAVEALCRRAILLQKGRIEADGPAREIVRGYLRAVEAELTGQVARDTIARAGPLEITRVSLHDAAGTEVDSIGLDDPLVARLHYRASEPVQDPIFEVGVTDGRVGSLALASMLVDGRTPGMLHGDGYVECRFERLPFVPRVYELWGGVRTSSGVGELVQWQRLGVFRLRGEVDAAGKGAVAHLMMKAPVRVDYRWTLRPGSAVD